jgi:nitrous oxidase accessory protein NosD
MIGQKAWIRLTLLVLLVAAVAALGLSLNSANDGDVSKSEPKPAPTACTQTLAAGTNLSAALASAAPGAVLCLHGGNYPGAQIPAAATSKASYVTLKPVPGESPVVTGELAFDDARHLRLQGLAFKGGIAFAPAASHVELVGNDLTGPAGIFFFGDSREGEGISSVLIQDNYIHDIAYTGSQEVYRGYGIKSIGTQDGFTVKGNTIKSVAADYLQTDDANNWTVEGNTFLGPSLVGGHPQEHQDLWQVYAGGTNLKFTGNVARNTGTDQSLLFQMSYPSSRFSNVVVTNNLFDHDSRGYTCQIYQSDGLVFRNNTVVGSRLGCLFRDDARFPDGSGYQVDHNVFAETDEGSDVGTEGDAGSWGAYDYNVSSDDSATGVHSVRDWTPSWASTDDYRPLGIPFAAGYRPGAN